MSMSSTSDPYTENYVAQTEHQKTWWGMQKCRKCNIAGDKAMPLHTCTDCNGQGWTEWASLANGPHHAVVGDTLWMGGCDYSLPERRSWEYSVLDDDAPFDAVVTMYRDWHSYGPFKDSRLEHYEYIFSDSRLDEDMIEKAHLAADRVMSLLDEGKRVMVRCQAGLNRSGLVTTLVMIKYYGFTPENAIRHLRTVRSPWVLCNEHYEDYLMNTPNP